MLVNLVQAVNVTPAQANGVIMPGGSVSSQPALSAANFYNLVASISTLTAANFATYYTANFSDVDAEGTNYEQLLSNYSSDVSSANYTQAQIDLIKLAAATFKNSSRSFIATALQAATDPWGSGKPFFSPGSPLNQFYVQFFVNQFAKVYAQLIASGAGNSSNSGNNSNNGGNSVIVINPGQKFVDPSGQMLLEVANDQSIIGSISGDGVQAISSAFTTVEQAMNGVCDTAQMDSNINNAQTKQTYLTQLDDIVTSAIGTAGNLQSIANNYNQQISKAKSTGISNLNVLANDGGSASLAAAYIGNISASAQTAQGQINTELNNDTSAITTLQTTLAANINKATSGSSSGSSNYCDLNLVLTNLCTAGEAVGTAVAAYLGKLMLCKLGLFWGDCPPNLDDAIKKITDSLGDLPNSLNDLLTKVGAKTLNTALDKMPSLRPAIVGQLSENLGLTVAQVNALVGVDGTSGTALANFMSKLNNIKTAVQAQNPTAELADIFTKIGTVLQQNPGIADINVLVGKVSAALGGGGIINPTGNQINVPGADIFNSIEYASQALFKSQLVEQIRSQNLSLADFQQQMMAIQESIESASTAAEKILLQNELDAANQIVESATNGEENPFVE